MLLKSMQSDRDEEEEEKEKSDSKNRSIGAESWKRGLRNHQKVKGDQLNTIESEEQENIVSNLNDSKRGSRGASRIQLSPVKKHEDLNPMLIDDEADESYDFKSPVKKTFG